MGKWCLHASSFIFDRIIIKVAGNQDRHKSLDEFNFGPLVSMAYLYVFLNEIWPWHIGLRWAIVALWATCIKMYSYLSKVCEGVTLFQLHLFSHNLSLSMTKPTKWPVRLAMTQISLGIRPVWSESSLYAPRTIKDPRLLQADSEDSDQTAWLRRLIWVFTWPTFHFVVPWYNFDHFTTFSAAVFVAAQNV